MTPTVSVLTCTYNRPELLAEALASVRAQTRPDWEHLAADNGSTDERVWDLLGEASRRDSRLRPSRYEKNVDQPARRWNDLIDRSRGKYLCFLDDDGTKAPPYLERLSAPLDLDPSIDLATCGFRLIREDGGVEENHLNLQTAGEIARRSTIDTGCFLIRRSALERIGGYFPLDIRTNEDWALLRRAASAGLRMVHLPDCLASWREHGEQRLRRARDLGSERDKIRILREHCWPAECRVRIYHPAVKRLLPAQEAVVGGYLRAARQIPWIRLDYGPTTPCDLAILIAPALAGGLGPEAVPELPPSRSTLVVHFEDPARIERNVDRLRGLAVTRDDVWAATNASAQHDDYGEIVGERFVAGPTGAPSAELLARLVNCVRAPRFEAELP